MPMPSRTTFLPRLLGILLPLWIAAAAMGQGTSGLLPDPMSARDLNALLDRLELSQQQTLAVSAVHDRYTSAFQALRDDEIEQFMEATQQLRDGFRFITEPDAVDDAIANNSDDTTVYARAENWKQCKREVPETFEYLAPVFEGGPPLDGFLVVSITAGGASALTRRSALETLLGDSGAGC